ncbi:hypothetical protein JTB14_025075 [Gonioctena quinquepunctata]|nr:hypothetical protein JTB14_025075 [Gonioctena quinquepunctata]
MHVWLPKAFRPPEVRHATIKMLITHALLEQWKIRQLNIPTAFLNGDLDMDMYIKIPDGIKCTKGNVPKLSNVLYGEEKNEKFNILAEQHGITFALYRRYLGRNQKDLKVMR